MVPSSPGKRPTPNPIPIPYFHGLQPGSSSLSDETADSHVDTPSGSPIMDMFSTDNDQMSIASRATLATFSLDDDQMSIASRATLARFSLDDDQLSVASRIAFDMNRPDNNRMSTGSAAASASPVGATCAGKKRKHEAIMSGGGAATSASSVNANCVVSGALGALFGATVFTIGLISLLSVNFKPYAPQNKPQLALAIKLCLQESVKGDCSGLHGPIGKWDVSAITHMDSLFENATQFNQDLSLWDVSHVTNMFRMFSNALTFDQDLSPWEVSNVVNMRGMFDYAQNLHQSFCTHAWAEAASRSHIRHGTFPGSPVKIICADTTRPTTVTIPPGSSTRFPPCTCVTYPISPPHGSSSH